MDNTIVIGKINEYLHKSTTELAKWLSNMLPQITDNWWEECVLLKISLQQRNFVEAKNMTKLSDFDLAALLRIADKNWFAMRAFAYLPYKERECIRDMQQVRNNWAHCGEALPEKAEIIKDLETIALFLGQMGAENALVREVEQFSFKINDLNLSCKTIAQNVVIPLAKIPQEENEIRERDTVYLIGNPDVKGMVFSVSRLGDITKYEVFVNGEIKTYYSGQIALVDSKPKYNWVDLETFKSFLTANHLNNPSSGNLYSLNSARIDFVPYQFRPALKLIKSDEPRILIADSVGVGKTIEAGLIIKELEARNELEKVMIICPKPLVTERKWELEMKRFDEEFIPLNGAELRQIISDVDRDGEWPARYGKTIVPYSILDKRVLEGEDKKRHHSIGLINLDPEPHFDLVIVDEAHHIRNGSTEKDKAYAYKCVKYFCDRADAVVMLTATPLQTGDDDLYTLLNLLRPDVVIDKMSFSLMSEPNEFISHASKIVRAAEDDWQKEAVVEIEGIMTTQWGANVIANNPIYSKVIEQLKKDVLTREERVELITDIESLHSFDTMLNRTRRKDIQDFCVRRSHTIETSFTAEQRKLHDELLKFEREALSKLHNARSVPFMMSTIRRQASSCIFGLAPYIRDLINRRFQQMIDDPDFDMEQTDIYGNISDSLSDLARNVLVLADNLPEEDPKFDSILEIIKKKQQTENNKIILFSTFRHTLAYIKRKLEKEDIRVAQVDGSVKDDTRCEYRERFELNKNDTDALDMLLFTEVGSEGLDYQFCDMMINYDLPWNPMRIEQRIGRIDRRGQKSDVVNIYNAITEGTVDADIYNRCLSRIGIFERSIGECEEILGKIGNQIEQIAVDTSLTEAERKRKLEQMADNEVRKIQELNKLEDEEKGLFGFDLSSYTTSKEIQEAENIWLAPRNLIALVKKYLNERLGEGTYLLGQSAVKTLRLSATNREELLKDFKKLSAVRNSYRHKWELYLKGNVPTHSVTFEQESAEKNRNAFFITSLHPLVRQAAMYFATTEVNYVSLKYSSDTIPKGEYPFSIYAWSYTGTNPKLKLVTVCENEEISSDWESIISSAVGNSEINVADATVWSKLENEHIKRWTSAKKENEEATKLVASYKLENIKNSYISQKRVLEQLIYNATEENYKRMKQGELESATQKYEAKVAVIEKQINQADIHISLVTNGIITVE